MAASVVHYPLAVSRMPIPITIAAPIVPVPMRTLIIETPPRKHEEMPEFDESIVTRMQEEIEAWRTKYF